MYDVFMSRVLTQTLPMRFHLHHTRERKSRFCVWIQIQIQQVELAAPQMDLMMESYTPGSVHAGRQRQRQRQKITHCSVARLFSVLPSCCFDRGILPEDPGYTTPFPLRVSPWELCCL